MLTDEDITQLLPYITEAASQAVANAAGGRIPTPTFTPATVEQGGDVGKTVIVVPDQPTLEGLDPYTIAVQNLTGDWLIPDQRVMVMFDPIQGARAMSVMASNQPPWSAAWGLVGYNDRDGKLGWSDTAYHTVLTVSNVTLLENRYYQAVSWFWVSYGSGNSFAATTIEMDGNTYAIDYPDGNLHTNNAYPTQLASPRIRGDGDPHTLVAKAQLTAGGTGCGAGGGGFYWDNPALAYLAMLDIGPVPGFGPVI
jgi:hypothetical protein